MQVKKIILHFGLPFLENLCYNRLDAAGAAACKRPFYWLSGFSLEGTKGDDAFVRVVFAILWQAAVETYAALAADLPLVIAAAQAALSLLGQLARRIKK